MAKIIIQEPDGNYDIYVPFRAVKGKRYKLIESDSVILRKEEIAESIEYIFKNTERIHGNSEAIDWIKVASFKCAEYLKSKQWTK